MTQELTGSESECVVGTEESWETELLVDARSDLVAEILLTMGLNYVSYEESRSNPNIVVDGSPNESTVLTLTHWPGFATPDGMAADLSAQIVFNYLDAGIEPPAYVVTSDHFDQDALVCIFALTNPDEAMANRELLIDLAGAGDFAVYRDRRAARASMVLSKMAEADMDTDYASFTDGLYRQALPIVMDLLLDPEPFVDIWREEDEDLARCETAFEDGTAAISEHRDLDLAVVTAPVRLEVGGHRFAGMRHDGMHPMAVFNRTLCSRVLELIGDHYSYTDRYESWVQFVSRPIARRRDLRPLAEVLTSMEVNGETWSSSGPGALTPKLTHTGSSSIASADVVGQIRSHLAAQPPAWNPFGPTNPVTEPTPGA